MSMKLFHRLHKVNLVTSTIIETIDGDDYDLIVVRVGQQQQEKSFEAPNSSGSLLTKASSATNFDAVIIMILLLLLNKICIFMGWKALPTPQLLGYWATAPIPL